MTHMVFMKFEPGFFSPVVAEEIAETFRTLCKELPDEIYEAVVLENCVERDTNMDLLIRMKLKNEKSLPLYLNHPAHVEIGRKINPHVINRCSFDCEE